LTSRTKICSRSFSQSSNWIRSIRSS